MKRSLPLVLLLVAMCSIALLLRLSGRATHNTRTDDVRSASTGRSNIDHATEPPLQLVDESGARALAAPMPSRVPSGTGSITQLERTGSIHGEVVSDAPLLRDIILSVQAEDGSAADTDCSLGIQRWQLLDSQALSAPGTFSFEGIELQLPVGGTIEGSLHAPMRDAAHTIKVAATNGDGYFHIALVRPDGHYRLEHLAPGQWSVGTTTTKRFSGYFPLEELERHPVSNVTVVRVSDRRAPSISRLADRRHAV